MQTRRLGQTGDEVSILGYGCMRFPKKGGRIDMERTEKQIMMAISKGVNYFDTAYIYPGSEAALGLILEKNQVRDKIKIATKIPPYIATTRESMEKILKTQLERLRTSFIDYYLVHALSDWKGWEKAKANGLMAFLEEKQKQGIIRHIGFSYHGDQLDFKKIVDDYPWDFCQIQYNYIDEHTQAGREGMKHAFNKGIGVVIMEPLRGGSIVGRMPDAIKTIWNKASTKRSYADWALRWLWDQKEVATVLSGLNEESHIEENIRVASEVQAEALTDQEKQIYTEVKNTYTKLMKVGCTGCGYCLPCPKGVNIPFSFDCYNSYHLFKEGHMKFQYLLMASGITGGKKAIASSCVECGKCEKHCPQHLPIREHLKSVQKEMEPWWTKPLLGVMQFGLNIFNLFSGRKNASMESQI